MLPRAGIDKKTDQKVFFFCTITEIFPKIVKNIIIFIEILRFCFFLNILPETFIKFSRENWIRTRYLDTELILGGRNVGRRALEMGVKGGPLIWGLGSTPP